MRQTQFGLFWIVSLLAVGVEASAAPEIHEGSVPSLRREPLIRAVVKVYSQFSSIDYGLCTGTFVSDSTMITAAHCLVRDLATQPCRARSCTTVARSVILHFPQPGGSFSSVEGLEMAVTRDDRSDLALVRFPSWTFRGRPVAYQLYSEELKKELTQPGVQLVTYGYGRTETGSLGELRSADIPAIELSANLFVTRDRMRIDHGDSGGPLLAYRPGKPPTLIAITRSFFEDNPKEQLFAPLAPGFFK